MSKAEPTLFDDRETSFFEKLEEVNTSEGFLSEEHTKKISAWVKENRAINAKMETLKKALKSYDDFISSSPIFGFREDELSSWILRDLKPKLENENTLHPKDNLLAAKIKEFVKEEWGVVLSEVDMMKKVNFLSVESITAYIAEETNYGEVEDLFFEQTLSAFGHEWRHTEFKLQNKKIAAIEAFYISDFDFDYGKLGTSYSGKVKSLKELLKLFHSSIKGQGYSAIDACFAYYERSKIKQTITKIEEGSKENGDTLMSTRLYKNGKFEMEFENKDTAQEFYANFILKAKDNYLC